jgi:hypothetical protein
MPKLKLIEVSPMLNTLAETITADLTKRDISVNENLLLADLQQLVLKHSGEHVTVAALQPPPILATEHYNMAGDLLIAAHVKWTEGDKNEALKTVATAMETPGIDELLLAINNANSLATIGLEGLATISQETETELAELQEEEEVTAELEDEDLEEILADTVDFEEEKPSQLRKVVERRREKHTELSREQKILANKLSLSGRGQDRKAAEQVIR